MTVEDVKGMTFEARFCLVAAYRTEATRDWRYPLRAHHRAEVVDSLVRDGYLDAETHLLTDDGLAVWEDYRYEVVDQSKKHKAKTFSYAVSRQRSEKVKSA